MMDLLLQSIVSFDLRSGHQPSQHERVIQLPRLTRFNRIWGKA